MSQGLTLSLLRLQQVGSSNSQLLPFGGGFSISVKQLRKCESDTVTQVLQGGAKAEGMGGRGLFREDPIGCCLVTAQEHKKGREGNCPPVPDNPELQFLKICFRCSHLNVSQHRKLNITKMEFMILPPKFSFSSDAYFSKQHQHLPWLKPEAWWSCFSSLLLCTFCQVLLIPLPTFELQNSFTSLHPHCDLQTRLPSLTQIN